MDKLSKEIMRFMTLQPPIQKTIIRRIRLEERYQSAKNQIIAITGDDNLIQIIEKESNNIKRRIAFLETTRDEILCGADYSKCKTIDDIAKVYSQHLTSRLGFL